MMGIYIVWDESVCEFYFLVKDEFNLIVIVIKLILMGLFEKCVLFI